MLNRLKKIQKLTVYNMDGNEYHVFQNRLIQEVVEFDSDDGTHHFFAFINRETLLSDNLLISP